MTDKEEFMQAVEAYGLDESPFELRFLKGLGNKYKGVYAGYFDDVEIAYDVIAPYWRTQTCYFSLQQINEAITARCKNRLQMAAKVTSDADVQKYRFLHVDIDPCRPAGIQASKCEINVAYKRACEIKKFLSEFLNYPDPIVVFSGNGTTLDYPLEPFVCNKENKKLVHNCLQALDDLFSDDEANVDTTVSNPSRIIKIPGTISAKGDDVPDRPYRFCKIMKVPKEKRLLTKSQLRRLGTFVWEDEEDD